MGSVFNGVKKRKITFNNKYKIYSTTGSIILISMHVCFYYRIKIIFIYKHNARCFAIDSSISLYGKLKKLGKAFNMEGN